MEKLELYLAGGVFNVSERLHNIFLAERLKCLGRKVILPQCEALKHKDVMGLNLKKIAKSCEKFASDKQRIFVGNLDGAEADSGMAVEYGVAIKATGRAVVYRTDIRTAPNKELGINAMFRLPKTLLIIHPCFFTEMYQVNDFYRDLARKINAAAEKLEKGL